MILLWSGFLVAPLLLKEKANVQAMTSKDKQDFDSWQFTLILLTPNTLYLNYSSLNS